MRSRGNGFTRHPSLRGARSKDLSEEDVAKGANHGCGSTHYFLKKSETRVIHLGVVVAEVLHLLR